jgi:hypothetical protein
MGKFLDNGDNDLALQIVMIQKALEQENVKFNKHLNIRIDKKIWLSNVEKYFRTLADFELFLEKRNALKTLDTMVDKIKREVNERKVNFFFI